MMGNYLTSTETFFFYVLVGIASLFLMECAREKRSVVNIEYQVNTAFSLKISNIYIFLSFLVLFLVLATRDHVGTDYQQYVTTYGNISINSLNTGDVEWLKQSIAFWWICKALSFFTSNYYYMFAVIGFITLFYFYKAIISVSCNWTYSLFLFLVFCLYYQSFNQVRQVAAIAIIAYSYKFLKKENFKLFVTTIIVASLFHLSALVFMMAWFIRKIKINFKNIFIYMIVGVIFFLFFDKLVNLFNFISYIRTYSSSETYSMEYGMSTILNFIVRLLMYLGCLMFAKKTVAREKYTVALYNIVAICTVLQIGAISFNIFGRITTYFYIAYIFLIPEVLKTIKELFSERDGILIYIGSSLLFCIYNVVYYFSSAGAVAAGYSMYASILFK